VCDEVLFGESRPIPDTLGEFKTCHLNEVRTIQLNATYAAFYSHPSSFSSPHYYFLSLFPPCSALSLSDCPFIPINTAMETRHDFGVAWLPRKLAGLLLLVVLYTPGCAHLFPASDSAKPATTVQPSGTVFMAMVTCR
jgi:hypothetical protein